VGPRVGLNGRKTSYPRDSITDRPARSSFAIPTELIGPHLQEVLSIAKCIADIHQELPNICVYIVNSERV